MQRLLVCLTIAALWAPALGAAQDKAVAADRPTLVPFAAKESQARLARSKHLADFFTLANQFEAQMNGGTCGPTTSVIVLNALRPSEDARRPTDRTAFPTEMRKGLPPGMEPVQPRYTQRAFLDARFEQVKPLAQFYGAPDAKGTRDPGLQLRQLHDVLALHDLDVTLRVVANDAPEKQIREELIGNLGNAGDYVIINYHRQTLGQPGGGHISPLAAYDKKSDSFLIMDVNPNRAPWVWVPARAVIAAMRTTDMAENRGYLLVRESAPKKEKKQKK